MSEYPVRGPLQQHRGDLVEFRCKRCKKDKKSNLVAIYRGDQSSKICNSCYGNLLSKYKVPAGTDPDDPIAADLDNACRQFCPKP